MQKHLQRRHQSIGATAVDELPATTGHGLALERIPEQILNGGPNRLG
jgi:hypothetical protein